MNLGNWQLDTVDGGTLALDGGVTFGIVPKPLWSKALEPDENNRVRLRNNCLLARDGTHVVLVDTGYGSKYGPLDRRFYEMDEGNPVLDSLARLGVAPEEIDTVVFTHLHFDHAGGAVHRSPGRELVPTFPRARHVVGRLEWEDATSRAPELETAYPIENLTPLANSKLIELIEGHEEIVPGLRARLTGGHTRGHMAMQFESAGQTALFIGDICATTHHLHRMWNLSYDTFPLVTRRVKPQLLDEAAAGDYWVLWPHDPAIAVARLVRNAARAFEIVDARERA